jgi:hypothetical protein
LSSLLRRRLGGVFCPSLSDDDWTRVLFILSGALEVAGVLLVIVDVWLDRRRAKVYLERAADIEFPSGRISQSVIGALQTPTSRRGAGDYGADRRKRKLARELEGAGARAFALRILSAARQKLIEAARRRCDASVLTNAGAASCSVNSLGTSRATCDRQSS